MVLRENPTGNKNEEFIIYTHAYFLREMRNVRLQHLSSAVLLMGVCEERP